MSESNGNGKVPAWLAAMGVEPGDYFVESKLPYRQIMSSPKWTEKQRVWACLRLATMAYQQELAVTMHNGRRVLLTPTGIAEQTGLSKQHVRRAMAELEDEGLAERRGSEGGPLHKGKVEIYCWAVPRPAKPENGSHRAATIFDSLGPEFESLIAFAKRWKISPEDGIEPAPDSLSAALEAVRKVEEAEKVAIALLQGVLAPTRPNKEERNCKKHERNGAGSVSQSYPEEQPTDRPTLDPIPEPEPAVEDQPAPIATTPEAVQDLCLEELGAVLPDETPGPAMCKRVAAKLPEPEQLFLLKARIKKRLKSITSMGMVEDLAEDVLKRWDADKEMRKAQNRQQKAAVEVCPRCRGTGITGGRPWSTLPDLQRFVADDFCGCSEGKVARELSGIESGKAVSQ